MSIKAVLDEVNGIDSELVHLRKQIKLLTERRTQLMGAVEQYMKDHNHTEMKYKNSIISVHKRKTRKKGSKAAQAERIGSLLATKYNIHNQHIIKDLVDASKGVEEFVEKIKIDPR